MKWWWNGDEPWIEMKKTRVAQYFETKPHTCAFSCDISVLVGHFTSWTSSGWLTPQWPSWTELAKAKKCWGLESAKGAALPLDCNDHSPSVAVVGRLETKRKTLAVNYATQIQHGTRPGLHFFGVNDVSLRLKNHGILWYTMDMWFAFGIHRYDIPLQSILNAPLKMCMLISHPWSMSRWSRLVRGYWCCWKWRCSM